jgi:carbon monoxide dehydrogenase subunit G
MTASITARSVLAERPHAVFEFLADLRNHALLAPGSVELRSRDLGNVPPVQAIVRLRGPLSIRRTATTAIVDVKAPAVIAGRARIGSRTRASISWTLASRGEDTSVTLRVTVEETGLLDSALLRLGGRGWLERRFTEALACLADQFAPAAAPKAGTGQGLALRPALQPAA